MAPNLGTKRQCPKCAAKFYDLGASGTITCPKCKHTWKEGDKKPRAKAKPAKPTPPAKKPAPKKVLGDALPEGVLPDVEEGDEVEELEPMDDEGVEVISIEEVEEHDEEKEADPESDDAEDEMFTSLSGEEKLVDDLEQYIEKDEDEEDGEEE